MDINIELSRILDVPLCNVREALGALFDLLHVRQRLGIKLGGVLTSEVKNERLRLCEIGGPNREIRVLLLRLLLLLFAEERCCIFFGGNN